MLVGPLGWSGPGAAGRDGGPGWGPGRDGGPGVGDVRVPT